MSDKPAAEPTMDEILASIRRIISEDPADYAPVAAPQPEPGPGPGPDQSAESSAEPEHEHAAAMTDETAAHDPTVEEPAHEEPMTNIHGTVDEPLVGEAATSASASAFDTLASTAKDVAAAHPPIPLSAPGRTLEDLTGELLRPLLKAWLDEHLPEIVRDRVDDEVRRIARSRVR